MPTASFRFYGPLNDFLPAVRRQATLVCDVASGASVKDLVEALGVPHTEINHLVVNGRMVDFTRTVRAGDRVAAYPAFRTLEVAGAVYLGPPPQAEPRFVADVHVGRLAAYLRLAGFDVAYRNDYSDTEIVAISAAEDRTVLTRDVGVLKHRDVMRGYFVRDTRPGWQLVEVLRRFDLRARAAPFTRCVRCNVLLRSVPKDDVIESLPLRTREHYEKFSRCVSCGRVYWAGSHYIRMRLLLDAAFSAADGEPHAGDRHTPP
ncbi:MAG: hypothetical protein A3H96_05765 [Acidobacteria bacterium RIFCSPLOWO2_02_FULL_67_36]|nr:MAG: hypothetical protein A3H96_05765 [Acidobacteria bacterium RIFCSPLOWO2_02_FULL_67_36]OFW19761.1 MAG: hypothetical protein A3G21_13345 [Acidobacteria bacterium RIFCSPLOWO2_12_FULL_66_21]